MAGNRFNLVTLTLSALLLSITTLALASSSSSSSSENNNAPIKMSPPPFPERWGRPPVAQTRDYVPLPGDYGRGSGTLRKWILMKMEEDVANGLGGEEAPSISSSTSRIAEDDGEELLWPKKNLVGYTGEDAKFAVLAGDKNLSSENVQILPEDSMVTMDYREDRVRIFVDSNGIVVRQPTIG
ncbi:hypothetical protein ACHAXA_009767 [Cyclostephanos tholiformis]|uniref:Uncharacterized protein n=1 Tax=Cyclostephanos tholiformis TaxID=382380 RepID=A0ABD3SGV1_9STRA